MAEVIYRLGNEELRANSRTIQVVEYRGVLYGILGGVKQGIDFVFASEEDNYDGHTRHDVLAEPRNIRHDVRLVDIVRPKVEPGDRLVAVVLRGGAPSHMRYPYQGNVVLFPRVVTEVIEDKVGNVETI
mgnify:CR=1 FL=1